MISINKASCGYNGKIILPNISLSLQKGEATCVLGANGVGKTTLFKTLLGLLPLLAGDIIIESKSLKDLSHRQLAKLVAYVPQAKNLSHQHPVEDVVLMGRAQYIKTFGVPSEKDHNIVKKVMASLNISHMLGLPYSNLSGGEQQLVLIARAIVQGASYILLDEPASNLDLANQSLLMQTINSLKAQGVGVLMISHVPTHAFACCENTLIIYHNGTSEYGPTEHIISTERLKQAYGTNVEIIEGKSTSGEIVHTYSLLSKGETTL